jgi:cytokinin dehydrogenase
MNLALPERPVVDTTFAAVDQHDSGERVRARIDRRPGAVAEASRDFGRLISGRAEGVLALTSADDIVAALRYANSNGLTVTPCGTRSSCGGQSLPNGGLALDLKTMNAVGRVDLENATIECEAGATLRSISEATLPHGLLPKILSFNLDITIGGVLSAGGFGANCHRVGPMVANVEALDVVTGAGELVHCSRNKHPDLFNAVLGGLGRCGVMARATLALRPIKPKVRLWTLLYHCHEAWIRDQEYLARSGQCDYMQGFLWAGPQLLRASPTGFNPEPRWLFGLSIGCEYQGEPPGEDRVLANLAPSGRLALDDAETAQFVDLYRDRFVQMRRSRAWERRHPWIDCIMSPQMVREMFPRILKKLPRAAGDGARLAWFPTKNLPAAFSVPPGDLAVTFAVLPVSIDESIYEETLAALDEVRRMLWEHGGKAYLVGWFGPMDDAAWQRHYGEYYQAWVAAKQKFDPRGVLQSMAFVR